MARGKYNKVVCDICGFAYPRTVMKYNSYGLWVCPTDNERGYDLVNHPQNKIISTIDRSMFIRDARPENNLERNLNWEAAVFDNWEDIDRNWNTI